MIILTSSSAIEDISRCYELTANSYVQKPFDLNEYFRTVRSIEEYWFGIASLAKDR